MKKLIGLLLVIGLVFSFTSAQAGSANLVWQNSETGDVWAWVIDPGQDNLLPAWNYLGTVDNDWEILKVVDLDKDGWDDVLWRYKPTGEIYVWLLDGADIKSIFSMYQWIADLNWTVK